jgi:shikimate kinase/3-dehydroquinate synthase
MKPAIVFIGFMGAGKSTALEAARQAGLATTEIDDLMADSFGLPIAEAFERHGEQGFRERESELVGSLLENADGGAIALGGGSILSERIRTALDRHVVVWLRSDAQESWRRIAHSDRPLATNAEDVARLMAVREPLYEELADAVIPVGDRGIVSRALPALIALVDLPAGTKMLWATSASGEYPVLVGRGLLKSEWWPLAGERFLVGDTFTVGLLERSRLRSFIGIDATISGEKTKTLDQARRILEDMARSGLTREGHVVALGGGVVGDIAGFCAHVYQRGVPVVQVPTTLVAQVDSAYGGKTGVDLPQGKNYAGAYHLPAAVIVDTATLTTLPREELAAGFVEALKTGLLAGGPLWERVRTIESLDPADLDDIVFACARYKCEVVAADERDGGLRHVLNLGHTIGHAIEAASDFSVYRHGEAIGLGLLAALRLSGAEDLRDEVEAILARLDLPVRIDDERWPLPVQAGVIEGLGGKGTSIDLVLEFLQHDKKRTAEGVGFVLLSEPGEPRPGQVLDPDTVRAAVEELYP